MQNRLAPRWLDWAREIQALAQTGDNYAENEYQRERYHRLMEIAAEIMAEHTGLAYGPLLDTFSIQKGYATPRVDVRGAVFDSQGRLLLVRERADGGWTMPGGWADVGDVPSESAEREVWEEAGYRVKARKVIGVYDANRVGPLELFHAFKLVFMCDMISGEATPSFETSAVAFFAQEEVPEHLSENRMLPYQIADAFTAYRDPDCPTFFD
jgi:ADP-ribose pyrophosphatase YjhB (NUDIX family)